MRALAGADEHGRVRHHHSARRAPNAAGLVAQDAQHAISNPKRGRRRSAGGSGPRLIAPAYAGVTLAGLGAACPCRAAATGGLLRHVHALDLGHRCRAPVGLGAEAADRALSGAGADPRGWPGALVPQDAGRLWRDDELRLGGLPAGCGHAGLWALAGRAGCAPAPLARLSALWGIAFTALSFLATAGFVSSVGAPGGDGLSPARPGSCCWAWPCSAAAWPPPPEG